MSCKLGDFEGTWNIEAGELGCSQITLEKQPGSDPIQYLLTGCHNDPLLTLDPVNFTLKNHNLCLSLGKECNRLVGISEEERVFQVWAAVRDGSGSDDELQLGPPPSTDPVLQKVFCVKAVVGEKPPVNTSDQIWIEFENNTYPIYKKEENHEPERYDTLQYNSANRTLDGEFRTVALWVRSGDPKNCLFGLLESSQQAMQRIREVLEGATGEPDIAARIEKILREEMKGLLPFEIDLLVRRMLQVRPLSSVAVWGAEEG